MDRKSGGTKAPKGRDDRLKSALKANLARRKAQARARTDNSNDRDDAAGDEQE